MITLILTKAIDFYSTLIIIYILSSWFPLKGTLAEIRDVLGSITEPYLALFRRFIPVMGNLDFSPIIAIIVLEVIRQLIFVIL